ncbi:hypothetical protein ACP4OV_031217 [Aristida adscensionis]
MNQMQGRCTSTLYNPPRMVRALVCSHHITMDTNTYMLPNLIALLFFFLATASLLAKRQHGAGILRKLAVAARRRASGEQGTRRRGLSIQVTDRAAAHRALVRQSAAFLNRPTPVVPSSILSQNRHYNILAARYGPYWRAVRRNLVAGVLSPSSGLARIGDLHTRVLRDLVRALGSGAPAGEALHFTAYSIAAEMCFGEDVVSGVGEAKLRAMEKFQWDLLLALPSFIVFGRYPKIVRLLFPARWRRLLAFRRHQEETYLPLVAEVRNRTTAGRHGGTSPATYVETLLDVRVPEEGDRSLTDGEIVSLMSEFLGVATETTAASLQWTMANLVKHPEIQEKLRREVDASAAAGERRRAVVEEGDLSRMPYLRAVVLESLRRHPPIPFVLRDVHGGEEAAEVLGVPRLPDGGVTVNFLVSKMGRDPEVWPEPMAFSPERFMAGGEGEGVDLACTREVRMMPFGAGRRACPGMALAMLHLEYLVANLVREFEWLEVDGDGVDLAEFHAVILTVLKKPLRARLVPRRSTTAAN